MDSAGTRRRWLTLARLLLWCVPLLWLSLPASAKEARAKEPRKNPHYVAALRLYKDLDYEQALQVLAKAAKWPANTLEQKVSIALLEGVLACELLQTEQGKEAFLRALAMNPDAKLMLSVSPKVTTLLEEVRQELLHPAPVGVTKPLEGSPKLVVADPPPPNPWSAPLQVEERSAPMNLKYPVAIGGGVIAAGGVLALIQANSLAEQVRTADRSITTRENLDATLQRGRTFETVGWALMGVGVATTVGSLLFLDTSESKPGVAVMASPEGAHLSLHGSLP